MFSTMEKKLYKRFIETRKEAKQIKRWWFNTQAKRIMRETDPEYAETFKMSARQFVGFCGRNEISSQGKPILHKKTPKQLRKSISELHVKTLREKASRKI